MKLLLNMFFRSPDGPGRLAEGGLVKGYPDRVGVVPKTLCFFEKTLQKVLIYKNKC